MRIVSLAVLLTAGALAAHGAAPPARPGAVVPVALYEGWGAGGKGPKMLEDTLQSAEFRVTRVSPEDIRAGKLAGYKVLIVPGGLSQTQGIALGEDGREMIRKFVADGGSYVGICAGCYLASCNYKWSLNILPVKVVDSKNWERGRGTLPLKLTAEGRQWFGRSESEVKTIYHNGPILKAEPDAGERLVPLALYDAELTRKGAKAGLMVNTPAIAAARYGKGWAVGVSPHPEQTEGLKDFVPAVIRRTLASPDRKR